MDNVPLDRYFIRKEIIEKRERQEYMQQIQIAMIPHMENDARNKILKELNNMDRQPTPIGKGTQTDYKALEEAKRKLNNEL